MKKSDQLKQERQGLIQAQENLIESRGNNEFTTEQETRFDDLQSQILALDKKIEREEQIEAAQLRAQEVRSFHVVPGGSSSEEKEEAELRSKFSLHKAINSLQRNSGLTGVEAELQQEHEKQAREAGYEFSGLVLPIGNKRASQNVTGDSGAYGGNMVQTDVSDAVIEYLRPAPVVESLGATFISDLTGNAAWPKNNGGVTATWEGEEDDVTPTRNAIGKKELTPHRAAAVVDITLQNLIQTSRQIEAVTVADINAAFGALLDAAAINGSGSGSVPAGILNTAGIGNVAAGTNGAAPIWKHFTDLEAAVLGGNYPASQFSYLINPGTMGYLKATPKVSGDARMMIEANQLNGYGYGVTTNVPNNLTKGSGTDLSAAIFGDFSQLYLGQFGFMDLVIDNASQATKGIVRVVVNSFFDVMVRQEAAFAAVKDLDLS